MTEKKNWLRSVPDQRFSHAAARLVSKTFSIFHPVSNAECPNAESHRSRVAYADDPLPAEARIGRKKDGLVPQTTA